MSNLHRLVYTSYRKAECTDKEIENILAACKRNNPGLNITGVLIHSKKRFIQYLEGDGALIKSLFDKIKLDPRHGSANLRNYEPISERVFPSWHMGYKDLSGADANFYTNISAKEKNAFTELLQDDKNVFSDGGLMVLKLFFKVD